MQIRSALAACFILVTTSLAARGAEPVLSPDGRVVSPAGSTLYSFDMDTPGESRCGRVCLMVWPPLTADADAREHDPFTLVEREDGTRQWAYRGKPLYRYIGDRERGEAAGEGLGGAWHTVLQ